MTAACLTTTLPEQASPADRRPRPSLPRRGRRGTLTATQERTIVARCSTGESTRQLARAFGVAQAAICGVLYVAGYTPRDGGRRCLTAEQEQRLAQQYAAGRTQQRLAEEYG